MYILSRSSKKNMLNIDSRLIEICDLALTISKVDFGIPSTGGLRTAEQQKELFEAGKSNCDGVNDLSYHQTGRALDFYAYVDGKASWNDLHLAMVATAFLQAAAQLGYPLKWGGNFKSFKDFPHVELES
jgi:peptidoglycan L-alanyl-D-glutamate endopeptidase CwlK